MRQRIHGIATIWVFTGFFGSVLMVAMAVAAGLGLGPLGAPTQFSSSSIVSAGTAMDLRATATGHVFYGASAQGLDLDAVTCSYVGVGGHRTGELDVGASEGVDAAATMRARPDGQEFTYLATTGPAMTGVGAREVTCSGGGLEAVVALKAVQQKSPLLPVVFALLSPVFFAAGVGAVVVRRRTAGPGPGARRGSGGPPAPQRPAPAARPPHHDPYRRP